MTTEALAARARGYHARAQELGCPDDGTVTGPALAALLDRRPRCYLCGTPMQGGAEFDHVRPLNGARTRGPNTLSNVLPACAGCNRWKGQRALGGLDPPRRLRACNICAEMFAEEGRALSCSGCREAGLPTLVRDTLAASARPERCERPGCNVAVHHTGMGRPRRYCSQRCQKAASRLRLETRGRRDRV